jgi:hypothetical protein
MKSISTDLLGPKPPSSYATGAGLTRFRLLGNIKWNLVRDNFEISTWLTLGALLQLLLLAAPVPPIIATGIAPLLFGIKILYNVLLWTSIIPNPRMKGVIPGSAAWSLPEGTSTSNGRETPYSVLPGNGEVYVNLITAQCHQ